MNNVLMEAIGQGNLQEVKRLIETNENINLPDDKGYTPLMRAVSKGYIDIVQLLLEHHAEVDTSHKYVGSALYLAFSKGQAEILNLLLAHGAQVDVRDKEGNTVLISAVSNGDVAITRLLLTHDADVNAQNKRGDSALIEASYKAYTEIVQLLLAYGGDVNLANEAGTTALKVAKTPKIRQLLEEAANWGPRLIQAAAAGDGETVQSLLTQRVSFKFLSNEITEAFSGAVKNGHTGIAKILLGYGASQQNSYMALAEAFQKGYKGTVNLFLEDGREINWALVPAASEGNITLLTWLLDQGADINAADVFGATALTSAAQNGHEAAVQFLLNWSAKANIVLRGRISAFMRAAENGHAKIVQLLLTQGVDSDTKNDALALSVQNAHADVVELLLKNGANANRVTLLNGSLLLQAVRNGDTKSVKLLLEYGARDHANALIYAVQEDNTAMVELLLDCGVYVDLMDENDESALLVASREGYIDIVEILLKHGVNVNDQLGDNSAVGAALKAGNMNIVRLLIDHGAWLDGIHAETFEERQCLAEAQNNWRNKLMQAASSGDIQQMRNLFKNRAMLHCADGYPVLIKAIQNGHIDIVDFLLQQDVLAYEDESARAGFFPYQKKSLPDEQTALICALRANQPECVKLLLEYEDPDYMSSSAKKMALLEAAQKGEEDIFKLLVEAKFIENIEDYDDMLFDASRDGQEDIVKLLLKYGTNLNTVEDPDKKALIAAAEGGYTEIVKLLLEHWGNNSSVDISKNIALIKATEEGHSDIIQLLLAYGAEATIKETASMDEQMVKSLKEYNDKEASKPTFKIFYGDYTLEGSISKSYSKNNSDRNVKITLSLPDELIGERRDISNQVKQLLAKAHTATGPVFSGELVPVGDNKKAVSFYGSVPKSVNTPSSSNKVMKNSFTEDVNNAIVGELSKLQAPKTNNAKNDSPVSEETKQEIESIVDDVLETKRRPRYVASSLLATGNQDVSAMLQVLRKYNRSLLLRGKDFLDDDYLKKVEDLITTIKGESETKPEPAKEEAVNPQQEEP